MSYACVHRLPLRISTTNEAVSKNGELITAKSTRVQTGVVQVDKKKVRFRVIASAATGNVGLSR